MNKPAIDKDQEGPSLEDVIGAMERLMRLFQMERILYLIFGKKGAPLGNAEIGSALTQLATIDSSLAVATAKVSQSQYKSMDSRYGAMSIDIFYCADASPNNQRLAREIM